MKKNIIFIILSFCVLNGNDGKINPNNYSMSSKRYITNADGSISMKINVWGHVITPGAHLITDGTDLISLLSLVGGPKDGANLKEIRLYREFPDADGNSSYTINLEKFIKTGDRSNFIKINPNDTLIIPQTASSMIIKQVGSINTLFSLIMIYLQIVYLSNK